MTKIFLIATVAALAITAPAQAQRAERDAERAEKAEERKAKAEQAKQAKAQRQQRVRVERPQRVERQRAQRVERPQRVERQRVQRVERPQRVERQRIQRAERQRPQRVERQRIQRVERPQRVERQRIQRAERPQRVERQRIQRVERPQRIERQRVERQASVIERRSGERLATQQLRQQQRLSERFARTQQRFEQRQQRVEMRGALRDLRQQQRFQQPSISVGERINVEQFDRDWYDDYATPRYNTFYGSSPNYFYNFNDDDGYLYRVDRDSYLVTALFPLLGGAFGVGQPMPYGYSNYYSNYNVPYGYRSLYYDTPDYYYRYGDGGIYRVDQSTQLITAVVALLTGQSLGIGQMLPMGYDVYNVPYGYRSSYFDSDDMWYRYNDGYIYGVDPYSRRIQTMYPVSYGGYAVGYPVPSYASYGGYTAFGGYGGYGGYPGYAMPYGYQNLYYGQPGYNYHYANNGIYQVDPATQLISALVALVTGTNLGVGQMLPMGYDAYNVPYQYRSSYFDTDDSLYRYDDGNIYQVDPRTRLIQAAIPVSPNGFAVGYPVPEAYPGYAVPVAYQDLYYASPGYDYRYANNGIYQIDPNTRMVQAVAALLTGQTLGVGQMLPMGYDAYNVPYAYRDRYYDNDRYLYRYADGNIYQVDPTTRLISAVIDAIV